MILAPRQWWAIGTLSPRGQGKRKVLKVRRLVVGRLLARFEKRAGEVIVQVDLSVTVPPAMRKKRAIERVSQAERDGEVA